MTPDLLHDSHAILGEGPFWHPRRDRLFWVDIERHAVHDTDPVTGRDVAIPVAEQVGCAVPAGEHLLVLGLRSGFAALDLRTSRRVHIVDPEHHLSNNRFNDGKCDPAGRLWAGTMDVSEAPGRGALYCLGTTLRVTCRVGGVSISNGLAWSADQKTMYFVDSPERCVYAYDYDTATGDIDRPRVVWEVPAGWGFPDGMTIDADDCLWIALWDGFKVVRLDPAAARIVDEIAMPVARPTSCAFGGPDLRDLYVTSASIGLTPEQLAAQPHAGGVFACRPGVTGTATVEFGGAAGLQRLFD